MTKKLKPCPFCGSKADVNMLPKFDDYKQVFCPTCGACNVWGDDAVKNETKLKDVRYVARRRDPMKPMTARGLYSAPSVILQAHANLHARKL